MNLLKLKESIKKYEGVYLKPYKCPKNKLTIGIGRNLEDRGIKIDEAEIMLDNDLLDIKLELEDRLPVFKRLDDVRRNVLVEMAFNIGVPKLLRFKNTIVSINNAVDFLEKGKEELSLHFFNLASQHMLDSKWHRDFKELDLQDGKSNNNGLLRSEYLAKLMKEGKY